ncbi:hypothetical protein HN51_034534 [Arachis hypogaea]
MMYFLEYFALFAAIISFFSIHIWRINRNLPIPNLSLFGMLPAILYNTSNIHEYAITVLRYNGELRTIVDLQDIFQRFTFDSICSMVLAFDPNCLPNKLTRFPEVAVEKAFNKMEDTILYRHLVPRWFWNLQIWLQIGHENDSIAILRIVEQFFHDRISSSPEERSGFNYTKDDESNFDMLKAPVEESGMEQVDHKFLRDIAVNLLAARRDTISASLCWFFWLVSTHPNVETKILG